MRKDYSTPVVLSRSVRPIATQRRQAVGQEEPEEEKQVDYSHLDIVAEAERIIERRLIRHTRTSGKYHCACPFPDCTSKQDAFTVWDRPVLEQRGDGRHEVHFWCGRCGRTGSLISLIRQYREATTGQQVSWANAARELRIDPRTWRARDDSGQVDQSVQAGATAMQKRRQQAEQQRQAAQAELQILDSLYRRARIWLAAGQVTMKDGRQIALDQARSYLHARGYTPEQAVQLGLAYVPTVQEVPELADLIARCWRGRVLFPLTGPQGASGYAGRTLWKWSPGMTPEQHKQVLAAWNEHHPTARIARHYKTRQAAYYGYEDACRASILVVVEGEFDAASVRLALADLPDLAVCAFGKHFSPRLVPLMVLSVILALDRDVPSAELKRYVEELEARGITVGIAVPGSGKDWNEYHQLVGLEAIREEMERTVAALRASKLEHEAITVSAPFHARPVEPPGYENGAICLCCGKLVKENEGAFVVCEDKASVFYGDVFCSLCWLCQPIPMNAEQSGVPVELAPERRDQDQAAFLALVHRTGEEWPEPSPIAEEDHSELVRPVQDKGEQGEQFTQATHRCSKHHRPLRYGDELGGRYCDHVDCWERYRLMCEGAARGYPALSGIIDPRDYLPDTSKAPLYHTASGLPIYPARPTLSKQLIPAGTDAWHIYVNEHAYHDIDGAIKALLRADNRSI
jgi:hypothetical protein